MGRRFGIIYKQMYEKSSVNQSNFRVFYSCAHKKSTLGSVAEGADFDVVALPYSNVWITTPERNFGSNHVVFGGIILPVSAMSISWRIETG